MSQQAKAKRDEVRTEAERYPILILKALIYADAFSDDNAVTVDNLHEITGITVEEIQFLACQLAAPGFAVLEGPTPAGSESEITSLYIETSVAKLVNFALILAQRACLARGRARFYREQISAMVESRHPWTPGIYSNYLQLQSHGAAENS